MLGLAVSVAKGGASLLTFVKDNLKLYLDFKSSRSDTLAFPSEGSTSFDGNDYIIVPDNDSLNIGTGNVTVSAWVKPTNLDANYNILDKRGSGNLGIEFMIHSTDRIFFRISDGTDTYYNYSGSLLTLGQWHHVCAVWNPSTTYAKFYLDGVDVGRQTGTTNANVGNSDNTSELRLGRSSNGYTNNYFDGKMANVAMWTRELSPEEVQSVMNKSYSQLGSVEKTSLVSWWALDNTSDRGADFWDVGVFTQEGSPTTSTYSNGLLNVVGNGNNTGAKFSFPSTGSTSLEGYNQYEFSFDIKITSGADSVVKIQYHYSGAISSTFNDQLDTTEAPNQEFKRFVTTVYNDNSASSNRYFVFVQSGSTVCEFQVKNIVLKPITANDSKGSNHGQLVQEATTTTSVYGGNAPILPRAIDIAESQAEQIGDGSAYFGGHPTDDHIVTPKMSINFNSFSISLWAKPINFTSDDAFLCIADTDSNDEELLLYNQSSSNNKFSAYIKVPNTEYNSTYEIPEGEWSHLTLTKSGTSLKLYANGIEVHSGSCANTNTYSRNIFIGARKESSITLDMNTYIAGVGIWQGALTQAQVQSLMESTSYAKIPASVKSTLSQKVTNTDFTTTDGWNTASDRWTIDTSAGTATHDGSDNFSPYLSQSNIFDDANALYKMTITIDSCENFASAGIVKNGSVVSFSGGFGITSTGTHTAYFTNSTSGLSVYSNGIVTVISHFSIEKVSNELVAYYPLGSDFRDSTDNKNDGFKGVGITGNSTRLRVPHHSDFDVESGEGFAAGGWIKVNTYNDSRWFLGKGTGAWSPTNTNGWAISAASSPQYWYSHLKSGGSNLERLNENGAGNVNKWIFMGIGRDGDGQGFKLNSSGRTNNGSKAGALTNTSAIYIGAAQSGNAIVSDIQQVFYFNRTLTQAEALELYNDGKPLRFDDLSSSLKSACKLWLPLQGDLNDVSGNGHNAEGW